MSDQLSTVEAQAEFDAAVEALYQSRDEIKAKMFVRMHTVPPREDNETRLYVVEKELAKNRARLLEARNQIPSLVLERKALMAVIKQKRAIKAQRQVAVDESRTAALHYKALRQEIAENKQKRLRSVPVEVEGYDPLLMHSLFSGSTRPIAQQQQRAQQQQQQPQQQQDPVDALNRPLSAFNFNDAPDLC